MRLTLVTPLFPPDVYTVATYHKDLAARLQDQHTVSVLLYGHLPEHVAGVSFITIDKRTSTIVRLTNMLVSLFSHRNNTDYYLVTNGPSTELPALFLSFITRTPIILLASDTINPTGTKGKIYTTLHNLLCLRARAVIVVSGNIATLTRPEIHPLITIPQNAVEQYEAAWTKHLRELKLHLS